MSKSKILSIICISVALCFSLTACVKVDESAFYGGETLNWNGVKYVPTFGIYKEGKTIVKTKNDWDINEVVGDKAHNFIVVRSFLDQYLLVREDYEIPKTGQIKAVYLKEKIEENMFCDVIQRIITADDMESFYFETDNIYHYAESIHLSYEDCPVGTEDVGFIGFIENKWVYIEPISGRDMRNEDGSPKKYTIECKIINEENIPHIEKYIHK